MVNPVIEFTGVIEKKGIKRTVKVTVCLLDIHLIHDETANAWYVALSNRKCSWLVSGPTYEEIRQKLLALNK